MSGRVIGAGNVTLLSELVPRQAVWLNREDLSSLTGAQWQGVATLALTDPATDLRMTQGSQIKPFWIAQVCIVVSLLGIAMLEFCV